MKIDSVVVPEQRTTPPADHACTYERGGCADSVIHAARKTLQGHRALCDAARSVAILGGRFDLSAEESCATCTVLVLGEGG